MTPSTRSSRSGTSSTRPMALVRLRARLSSHSSRYPYPHRPLAATSPTGPYDWSSHANLSVANINPAALVYPNASSSSGSTYSVWLGGVILVAETADGPFSATPWAFPGGSGSNPAPVYLNGTFYLTNQGTDQIWSTPSLDKPWTVWTTIPHPAGLPYTVEDPYMWIDPRGNWHVRGPSWHTSLGQHHTPPLRRALSQVINHAYNTGASALPLAREGCPPPPNPTPPRASPPPASCLQARRRTARRRTSRRTSSRPTRRRGAGPISRTGTLSSSTTARGTATARSSAPA